MFPVHREMYFEAYRQRDMVHSEKLHPEATFCLIENKARTGLHAFSVGSRKMNVSQQVANGNAWRRSDYLQTRITSEFEQLQKT